MATDTAGGVGRELSFNAMHFMRKSIAFDTALISTADTVKVGDLPPGAVVFCTQVKIVTAFNAATTNYVNVGIVGNGDALVDNDASVSDALLGSGITGSFYVWRGGDVAFSTTANTPVYVTYTETGTAASTGAAEIIVMFTVDNDG